MTVLTLPTAATLETRDDYVRSHDAAQAARPTCRRLDIWIRSGLIHAEGAGQGSGSLRYLHIDEVKVLSCAVELTEIGLAPPAAVEVARRLGDSNAVNLGPFTISRDGTGR